MKRRVLSLLLCACMVLSTVHLTVSAENGEVGASGLTVSDGDGSTVSGDDGQANSVMLINADELATVYVDDTVGNDSNSGISTAPVQNFEKALELVADGGTIIIGENGAIAGVSGADTTTPLVIDKAVTIKSENGGDLNVRQAGIILGANVTFENMAFALANRDKNAIFANGHTLTLTNVTQLSGTRQVHLFAGGLNGDTTTAGSCGTIIINGNAAQFGNLYAGGMDCSSNLPASITINGTTSMSLGAIYASGAAKGVYDADDLFSGEEPEAPAASSTFYPVNGAVTINLNNSNVTSVNGATGGTTDASVVISTQNLKENLSLENIASLNVSSGEVKPVALNSGVDVSIASGGILDLSGVMTDNTFSVQNFTGGGTLQLSKNDTLTITGAVSGNTEFRTPDGPTDKSTSGPVVADHGYIDVSGASSVADTATFTFTPYATQTGMTLEKKNNIWTIVNSASDTLTLTSFAVKENSLTVDPEDINLNGDVSLGVTCTFDGGDGSEDIGSIPISYKVCYNEQVYNVAATEMQEYPGYYEGRLSELNLRFEPMSLDDEHVIYIYQLSEQGAAIASGSYFITIIAPTSSGDVEQMVTLTVTGEAVTTSYTVQLTGDTTAVYGDSKTFPVTITRTGDTSAAVEGIVQLYDVNNNPIGEAQTVNFAAEESGKTVQMALDKAVLTAGTHVITAKFTIGTEPNSNVITSAAHTIAVSRATVSAPAAFTLQFALNQDGKTYTATIPAVESGLYSFDGVNFSTVNTKTDCAANTAYTGYVKYAQTGNYEESAVTSNTQTTPKLDELEEQTQIVKLTIADIWVPEGLKNTKFNTPEAIISELQRVLLSVGGSGYTTENMVTYDVTLQISTDGGNTWVNATEDNFPAEGITITLPYPSGTGKDTHDFIVTHMFTMNSTRLNTVAGETEQPQVTKLTDGIQVTLKGLSPVGIAWKTIEQTPDNPQTPDNLQTPDNPQTSNNSQTQNTTLTSNTTQILESAGYDEVPKSGDSSPVVLCIFLLGVSVIAQGILWWKRRKEIEE